MSEREISVQRKKQLHELSEVLGIQFKDISLLEQALTHTSYANEVYGRKSLMDNERLEFLGDAVLETSISNWLFEKYPRQPEGNLTKMRASIVCEATLSKRAIELGFDKYILLGKGERRSGGSVRPSTMEDAFEAVIGAVFKDQGWEVARAYVLRQLSGELEMLGKGKKVQDYKSTLQEMIQSQQQENAIRYELLRDKGPDHNKTFEVAVFVNDIEMGVGIGHSKKIAEQQAACEALKNINK